MGGAAFRPSDSGPEEAVRTRASERAAASSALRSRRSIGRLLPAAVIGSRAGSGPPRRAGPGSRRRPPGSSRRPPPPGSSRSQHPVAVSRAELGLAWTGDPAAPNF